MFLSSTALAATLFSLAAMLLTLAVICFCSVTMLVPLMAIVRIAGQRYVAARLSFFRR
jgi:hypothetical protein